MPAAHETNSNTSTMSALEMSPVQTVDFIERDGARFAGLHLLVEFWQAKHLSDVGRVERALVEAAEAAGATVLHSYFHPFGPELGVSGVVVLAESHISIHTWPERAYAAIDVFMCGDCDPHLTIPVLKAAFAPARVAVAEHRRGLID
jgi:S-adenosylmethionine decarboxylase